MFFFLASCTAACVVWVVAMVRGSSRALSSGDTAAAEYYERRRYVGRHRELRRWNRRHRAVSGEFTC